MMDYVEKLFTGIDRKRDDYDAMLKNEQKPASGSGEGPKRALDWVSEKLRKAGALIEPLESAPGSPPVLRAVLGKIRDKRTILIYAHLNPACRNKDLKLFGNGMVDAKGPLLCLFHALDTYKELKIQVPVNLRFICEAMLEKDADGFRKFLDRYSGSIFTGVDYITVLDNRPNYFYGIKPLLCWSLRGCCKFQIRIDCASKNLDSGDDGGAIQEATTDMVKLLSSLTNTKGDILITGINDDIAAVTPQEEQDYHKATFDVTRYKNVTSANVLLHKEDKKRVLMHMTRFPSLSIHGITSKEDLTTGDIPGSVTGTFTIRTVPYQTVSGIQECVTDHINRTVTAINTLNKVTVTMTKSSAPWEANPRDPNIQSALRALKRTFKEDAELVREGGTVPILRDLQELSGKQVLMLPIGRTKCHSPSLTESTIFIEGSKTISAYFFEASN